jgi:hypothetical protein
MRAEEFINENLHKWFKEKWVRFGPDGKIRGDCARGSDSEGKPKCLPQSKAHALGKKGRASAAARKRRQDPNPERHGPAKNVATKEAANPAQQAAIAIAMKKAHKKPKTEGVDIGQEWMSDTELDQYVPDQLQQQWRELLGYDQNGNPSALWVNLTGGYEPDVRDPEHRALMVKVANKWFAAKKIPNVKFYDVKDADDELEWLVQIGSQDMMEGTNPADTLYFFDVARGGRSFDHLDLKIMGLKQSQKGKWYYQPGRDSTDLLTNATLKHLEKTLNVPARAWKLPVEEQQLAELKCWTGYTRVPGVPAGAPGSCRKKTNEAEQCPECGGPMFSELMINEKQDACYYKVKSRYKVWPSAYASGALVQCRKKGAANWGNKSK